MNPATCLIIAVNLAAGIAGIITACVKPPQDPEARHQRSDNLVVITFGCTSMLTAIIFQVVGSLPAWVLGVWLLPPIIAACSGFSLGLVGPLLERLKQKRK